MIELGVALMLITVSAVVLIIAVFVFIDMQKEGREKTHKVRRNFGFPGENIDIDRKDKK